MAEENPAGPEKASGEESKHLSAKKEIIIPRIALPLLTIPLSALPARPRPPLASSH